MATIITSTVKSDIPFTAIQTYGTTNANETASLGHVLNLTYGTGTGEINAGIFYSGYLPQGGEIILDFNAFPKTLFGATDNITFTGGDIKGIVLVNKWNGPDDDGISSLGNSANISVRATGEIGFSGLFNGGSGDVKVVPNCTWLFLDQQGVRPTEVPPSAPSQVCTGLTLRDVDGSGVPFSMVVVGVTGHGLGGI